MAVLLSPANIEHAIPEEVAEGWAAQQIGGGAGLDVLGQQQDAEVGAVGFDGAGGCDAFVEQIVIPTYPLVGRWLPAGAADAWLQLGPALDLDGRLPPAPLGGLVLIVYTALAIILARKLTLQRDVL